nr:MAG TPA: hypothetical protein [Caudoviricetes sp.]
MKIKSKEWFHTKPLFYYVLTFHHDRRIKQQNMRV